MADASMEPTPEADEAEELLPVPGFSATGLHCGLKDDGALDFGVVHAERECSAAAMFTRHRFPGAPVIVGREHLARGGLQTVVVNAKNANVATGKRGIEDCRAVCQSLAEKLRLPSPHLVFPSSTGVIGVPLPLPLLLRACDRVPAALGGDAAHWWRFARAIMTTDKTPKVVSQRVGEAVLTGVAKGAGMVSPQMATMLVYLFTDAQLESTHARDLLREAVSVTFNRISIDSDTSTSDTVVLLANGRAGPPQRAAFAAALQEVCERLARKIVADGEGASKGIELWIEGAPSTAAAEAYARAVIDSPLIKTAIHGADPNWGRFVMAIGKALSVDPPPSLDELRIGFGPETAGLEISAASLPSSATMVALRAYLAQKEVLLRLRLGNGEGHYRMWGCALSEGYVQENAYYTT